jgi:DNA gyrase subunit A
MILRVAKGEHVVSVAKIDESEEVEIEALDELAPIEDAVIGDDLAEGPADGE